MTIGETISQTRDTLATWAEGQGGSAEIARDIVHLYALVRIKPGGFRVIVHFLGEEKRGTFEEAGQVDRKFWVVISFGQSLQLDKGDALIHGQAGGRPLFDLAEEVREQIRAISFDPSTTEETPDLRSITPFAIPSDVLLDAYTIEFWIGCQLPVAGSQIQSQ